MDNSATSNPDNFRETDKINDDDILNTTFINDIWIIKPAPQIIIETTVFVLVVIFGLFGNILSIYVLAKNRRICTPTNLLIGNMAAADLLSLLINPGVFLTLDFFQNYQLGVVGCKTEGAIECSVLLVSVITVSAISYDRLIAILLPGEAKLTIGGAKIVIFITWIAAILISSPLMIYRTYKERQWLNFLEKYCTENKFITSIYWHVIITVLVWLPLVILLICYSCIFFKLHKYEKIALRKFDHHQINYKKKAVRMMIAIILTFLICRLPFTVLIFYRDNQLNVNNLSELQSEVQNLADGAYHTIWFISKFLIYLNTALNPLIYSVTNEKFQKGLKATKLGKWFFPNEKPKISSPKQNHKTLETSLFRRNLLLIFKKRQKTTELLTIRIILVKLLMANSNLMLLNFEINL